MAYTPDFSAFNEIFVNSSFFGASFTYIVPLIFLAITLVFITRDKSKWGMLTWPLLVAFDMMGMSVPTVLHVAAAMYFVVLALSLEQIGDFAAASIQMAIPKTGKIGWFEPLTKRSHRHFERKLSSAIRREKVATTFEKRRERHKKEVTTPEISIHELLGGAKETTLDQKAYIKKKLKKKKDEDT